MKNLKSKSQKKNYCILSTVIATLLMSSCSSVEPTTGNYNSAAICTQPIQSEIMKKAIAYEGINRNPVIIIHGFLGSKLNSKSSGKCIWGNFSAYSAFAGYSNTELYDLSYPMVLGEKLSDIPDNAVSTSIMNVADVSLAGFNFKIDAYSKLIKILQSKGFVLEGEELPKDKNYYSLFIFHYDWRKDLVANSALLHQFILEKRKYIQEKYKQNYNLDNYDVQFDFVAHSMGGLLSRYYLMYGDIQLPEDGSVPYPNWNGSKFVDKAVIIGTPNAGYLDTFYELLNGYSPVKNVDPYPAAVTGTWATYYQMLPLVSTGSVVYNKSKNLEEEYVDIFNPRIWMKYKWGLAGVDDTMLQVLLPDTKSSKKRKEIAVNHLSKCLVKAKQFTDALKVKSEYPDDVKLYLFFGNAVETKTKAVVDRKTGKVDFCGYDSGDGIVCTSSALCDMREGNKWTPSFISPIQWYTITPLMAAHVGLTESPVFANIIGYCLLFDLNTENNY